MYTASSTRDSAGASGRKTMYGYEVLETLYDLVKRRCKGEPEDLLGRRSGRSSSTRRVSGGERIRATTPARRRLAASARYASGFEMSRSVIKFKIHTAHHTQHAASPPPSTRSRTPSAKLSRRAS